MMHTILFVDDEEMVLAALKRAMRQENVAVFTARNAEEAMNLIAGREFHVVISDQNMPGMSGLALLSAIKRDYPEIITMMLTGQSQIDIAMRAINDAGVYKFILKPWDPHDLAVTIRRACESLELMRERNVLAEKVRIRDTMLKQLEKDHPGITRVTRDEDGYIIADM